MFRSLGISSLLMLVITIGLWTMNGGVIIVFLPVLVFLAIEFIYRPTEIKLSVNRVILSDRIAHNGTIDIRVEVTNKGAALEEVFLEDLFPTRFEYIKGDRRILCSLPPGESVTWEYQVRAVRGEFRFFGVSATITSHLGLFRKELFFKEETAITVKPDARILKKVDIRPRRTQVYTGTIPTRTGGSGIDYYGMREYKLGDSPRLINWRALARHQDQLFTNEFERERMANIGLVFDCRKSAYNVRHPRTFLDLITPSAVALSNALLRDGNRVGLLVYGAFLDWTHLGSGKRHKERITRSIARIELKEHDVFDSFGKIPKQLFPAQSQLIIFSPLKKDDYQPMLQLKARGYQITVISPNPISFERQTAVENQFKDQALRILTLERELMLRKMLKAGIHVINWDITLPFHELVERFLNRRANRNIDIFKAI